MKNMNTVNRAVGLILLLAFLVNIVMPFPGAWGVWVMRIGLILLLVHAIEFAIVYKRLEGVGHATPVDFFWVLLLGFMHWKPLLPK